MQGIEPSSDWESREYWEGARRGELLIKRCRSCDRAHWYPRAHCPYCHADDPVWEPSSGRGTIYTFTVIRQNNASAFRERIPYTLGLVDLVEGPRVFGTVYGDHATLRVGAPVSVAFDQIGEDTALPVFVLDTDKDGPSDEG